MEGEEIEGEERRGDRRRREEIEGEEIEGEGRKSWKVPGSQRFLRSTFTIYGRCYFFIFTLSSLNLTDHEIIATTHTILKYMWMVSKRNGAVKKGEKIYSI